MPSCLLSSPPTATSCSIPAVQSPRHPRLARSTRAFSCIYARGCQSSSSALRFVGFAASFSFLPRRGKQAGSERSYRMIVRHPSALHRTIRKTRKFIWYLKIFFFFWSFSFFFLTSIRRSYWYDLCPINSSLDHSLRQSRDWETHRGCIAWNIINQRLAAIKVWSVLQEASVRVGQASFLGISYLFLEYNETLLCSIWLKYEEPQEVAFR